MIKVKGGELQFKDEKELDLYLELGTQILDRDKKLDETYIKTELKEILKKDTRDKFAKYMLNNGWDYICHAITKSETVFIICNTEKELNIFKNEVENINNWTICINSRLLN